MTKIEKLTPEQENKMNEVKQYWLDYIFSCRQSVDRLKADVTIEWLYKFVGRKKPVIIYLDSPMGCQYGVHLLKTIFKGAQVRAQVGDQVRDQVWDQVRAQVWAQVRDQVRDQVGAQVRAQVRDQVWDQVWDQVRAQVWDQVRAQVRDQVRAQVGDQKMEFQAFCQYGSVTDYGWISFYDFFTQIGIINHEGFNEFKRLLQCGIYDTIQLNGFCIVSELPVAIYRNNRNRLHCESGPAIKFRDGYSQYHWNGVSIPSFWITDKEKITRDVIIGEGNAEKRRCLREILGAEKYFEVLGGVVLLDTDTDDQGNEMQLFRSKDKDDLLSEYIQFLKVICPSTKREYVLYPPNQKSNNVWDAKASTFKNEKIQVRHGDVGLLNIKKEFSKPLIET